MEVDELLVLKISDELRLATRIESILRIFEEVLVQTLHESFIRVAHGAFHLIIDNTFVGEARSGVIWILKLQTVTLLSEVIVVEVG